jgi:putative peptidoglycan lipid II flippase
MSILGLPGMACSTVVMRGLYALGLAKGAFYNTLLSVVCTLISSLILLKPFGLAGLAVAPSIAFTIASVAGIYVISKELLKNEYEQDNNSFPATLKLLQRNWAAKITLCLFVLSVSTLFLKEIFTYDINAAFIARAVSILCILTSVVFIYAVITYLLKFDELNWLRTAMTTNKKDIHH